MMDLIVELPVLLRALRVAAGLKRACRAIYKRALRVDVGQGEACPQHEIMYVAVFPEAAS